METTTAYTALIPGLPDDMALLCLARVGRDEHSVLTKVARGWRDVLRNPNFYELRKSEGVAEEWLYMCRTDYSKHRRAWFAFSPKTGKWIDLPPIPADNEHGELDVMGFNVVSVENVALYILGGVQKGYEMLRHVTKFDPTTGVWSKVQASMNVPRHEFAAAAVNGKIYVAGGYNEDGLKQDSAEVYNVREQTWCVLPRMPEGPMFWLETAAVGGKVYVKKRQEFFSGMALSPVCIYDTATGEWTSDLKMSEGWTGPCAVTGQSICSVDNMLNVKYYDVARRTWKPISCTVAHGVRVKKVVSLAGKLYVMADCSDRGSTRMLEIQFTAPSSAILYEESKLVGEGSVTDVAVLSV